MSDSISEFLDTEPIHYPTVVEEEQESREINFEEKVLEFRKTIADNATLDFKDARNNLLSIIEAAMELIPDVKQSVRETRSEKSIDAAGRFFKVAAELNHELIEINTAGMKNTIPKGVNGPTVIPLNGNQTDGQSVVLVSPASIYRESTVDVSQRFAKKDSN